MRLVKLPSNPFWESYLNAVTNLFYNAVTSSGSTGGGGSSGGGGTPGGGGGTIIIPDEEIPAGEIPEEDMEPVEIMEFIDEEIPAGDLPQTGGFPALALYGIGAMVAAAGTGMRLRERRK
ncbi:MAG: hypothetical protein ACOX5F_02155 [Anaerovoracaceae bacterium]|jgi:hypothetical protein